MISPKPCHQFSWRKWGSEPWNLESFTQFSDQHKKSKNPQSDKLPIIKYIYIYIYIKSKKKHIDKLPIIIYIYIGNIKSPLSISKHIDWNDITHSIPPPNLLERGWGEKREGMEITVSWTRKFPPRERGNRPKNGEISSNFSHLFSEFQLSTDFSYRPNSANVKKSAEFPQFWRRFQQHPSIPQVQQRRLW